jgi:flagellar basal body rod protein FlgG
MNVNSVLNTGLHGIQKGFEGVEKAATEIVRGGADGPAGSNADMVEPLVDLKLYERAVEASAQIVKTADEVLGTLLDTLA